MNRTKLSDKRFEQLQIICQNIPVLILDYLYILRMNITR